ncbi:MAG: hypothetical protein ACYDEP_02030 [Acidimicrobiales bacterium]
MTQPSFVPIAEVDQVRRALHLSVPGSWSPARPAELKVPRPPMDLSAKKGRGTPGPDQGFALSLARRFLGRLRLEPDESPEDAIVGCALLASCRAGMSGRAPSVHDVEVAFALWGFLGDAPKGLVELRKSYFRSASHEYDVQRRLVDQVPPDILELSLKEVEARSLDLVKLLARTSRSEAE